jgi:hypothetical protein
MSYPCLSNTSPSVVVAGCSVGLCVVMISHLTLALLSLVLNTVLVCVLL